VQKHGVKTLNRDRDSLKEEQNLSLQRYEIFLFVGSFVDNEVLCFTVMAVCG